MGYLRGAGIVLCVVALAGCAFGEERAPDQIGGDELAIMVLPREDLGTLPGLEVDPEDSGRLTARELADDTIDPGDTPGDMKRAGWVDGYELNYSDPARAALFKRGEGLILAGSMVRLFETETDARAYALDEIRQYEVARGKKVQGVRLAEFEMFEADAGDEAWGAEYTAHVGRVTFHATGVMFRSGRLVADAYYIRADDTPSRADAVSAAQRLEARIGRVLAGDLDDEPVPLPATDEPPTTAELSRMTLNTKDLPAGAVIADEGRASRGGDYVSYYRQFDVSNTMIGRSHLLSLRAQTNVFKSGKAAETFLRYLGTPRGRERFARVVQREIQLSFKQAAVAGRARNFDVRALRSAGREATGVVVTFDLPTGRYRIASVFVRSGRAIAMVSGFCTAEAVHPDDLPPLGDKARERLASIPV